MAVFSIGVIYYLIKAVRPKQLAEFIYSVL